MKRKLTILSLVVAGILGGCAGSGQSSAHVTVTKVQGEVTLTSSGAGRADVNAAFWPASIPAVHFSAFDDPSHGISDLYVFGVAPAGTETVATTPSGSATVNQDLTFVVVIANAAGNPIQSVHWEFLDDSENVLAQGDGPNS